MARQADLAMAQNCRGYWNMDLKGKVMASTGGNRQLCYFNETLWGGKDKNLKIYLFGCPCQNWKCNKKI